MIWYFNSFRYSFYIGTTKAIGHYNRLSLLLICKSILMRNLTVFIYLFFSILIQAQAIQDNFEGSGNITTWFGDDWTI